MKVTGNKLVPRCLMLDLEPRVINNILGSTTEVEYNKSGVFIPDEGGGAGNNWAFGFSKAEQHQEKIMAIIDRELENSDNPQAFVLCHSIAGGTGSGLGSFLIEQLKEQYGKKKLITFSLFPNTKDVSDVVVQPYNAILSLKRLIRNVDATVVLDNCAINKIASNLLNIQNPTFTHTNQIVLIKFFRYHL